MSKQFFALKLIPPRPTFAQDMTDEERSIMQEHVGFWMDLMKQGKVIVFGPVLDPQGVYGFGVVAVDNEEEVKQMIDNDPATKMNRYEYYPMKAVTPQG
jgi:uncharacterized protein YciI